MGTTRQTSSTTGKKAAKSPNSAFEKKGKSIAIEGKSDPRNQRHMKAHKSGCIIGHGKKFNKDEEMFAAPLHNKLDGSPKELEQISCSGVFEMRGVNGTIAKPQKPGGTFGWRCLLFRVSADDNTEEKRKALADGVVQTFNANATIAHCRCPGKMRGRRQDH